VAVAFALWSFVGVTVSVVSGGFEMQDFRTRLVCPYCGASDGFQLIRYGPAGNPAAVDECIVRRCLACHGEWPVDDSLRLERVLGRS
jgi:hypothetical protein